MKLIICTIDNRVCDLNKQEKKCRYLKTWGGICPRRKEVKRTRSQLREELQVQKSSGVSP